MCKKKKSSTRTKKVILLYSNMIFDLYIILNVHAILDIHAQIFSYTLLPCNRSWETCETANFAALYRFVCPIH